MEGVLKKSDGGEKGEKRKKRASESGKDRTKGWSKMVDTGSLVD